MPMKDKHYKVHSFYKDGSHGTADVVSEHGLLQTIAHVERAGLMSVQIIPVDEGV
jgi:hypothetical protein